MSTPGSASHGARRRHSTPIRDLRALRHPNEPHSGPRRALRTVGVPWDTLRIGSPWRLVAADWAAHHPPPGSSSPAAQRVPTAWSRSARIRIRLTCRLGREDCSLCDRTTKLRGYLSTKPGQLQSLVTSATASGKTEAILAPLLSRTRERTPTNVARIRILLIAPTRALVNDLAGRLETPLTRLRLTWGRQTSDHREKDKQPFLLITTPESFDSMLVRDGRRQDGKAVDHLLAGVAAVFIDEAHLFDGTARGDQLCWLLGRLRRLRQLHIYRPKSPIRLQACAGSATVSNPEDLAHRLLGPGAISVRVQGTRKIKVFDTSEARCGRPLMRP